MSIASPPISQPDSIAFEARALKLLGEFDRVSSQVMERSVIHARLRSATIVLPEDVQAAFQEAIAALDAAFVAAFSRNLNEIELTDADFVHLNRLPFNREDKVNDADDDL
jgi:hypothetical protein